MKSKLMSLAVVAVFVALAIFFAVSVVVSKEGMTNAAGDRVKRGEKLVMMGGCNDCHSPKKYNAQGPYPDATRLLSGHPHTVQVPDIPAGVITPNGWAAITNADFTAWAGPWGISYAANLTPDNVTGIGAWNEQVFINAMRTGKHMGAGRPILPPMPRQALGQLSDEDLKDIFAYLKSLPPVSNQVPPPVPPAAH
ncbi:Cytochrome c [Candidatus Zixiibacteriota bacterium]|nr:Cytochrome c [candidate division Zixibacteria bacterium]